MRPSQKGYPQEREEVLQGRKIRLGPPERGQESSPSPSLEIPGFGNNLPGSFGELLSQAVASVSYLNECYVTRLKHFFRFNELVLVLLCFLHYVEENVLVLLEQSLIILNTIELFVCLFDLVAQEVYAVYDVGQQDLEFG